MRKLDLETADKQRRALQLRNVGVGYDRIADELGYADRSGAWRAVDAAVKRSIVEPAEHQRVIMAERLDTMLQRAMDAVLRGDLEHIDRVLRIERQRAELFGLNAPRGFQITGPGGGPVATDIGLLLRERLAAMRVRADATPAEVLEIASGSPENGQGPDDNGQG